MPCFECIVAAYRRVVCGRPESGDRYCKSMLRKL